MACTQAVEISCEPTVAVTQVDTTCGAQFVCQTSRTVERAPLQGHYSTTSEVVHQAVTRRDAGCATLVLRGPRERRTSTVYYAPGEPAPRGGVQLGRWIGHDVVLQQVEHVVAMVSGR